MKKIIALLITLVTILGPTTGALARSHHNGRGYRGPRHHSSRYYHDYYRSYRHHHHHHGHGGAVLGGVLAGVILGTVIANSTKDKSPTPTEECKKD